MKNKIHLIAETTRTANGQRRYIIAPNHTLKKLSIASLITEAHNKPQSTNYISISNKEEQLKLNQVDHDILVLVGIEELTAQEREQAIQFLNQRLKDLENMVTQKIEWEMDDKELFLNRVEFAQWERDLIKQLLNKPEHKTNNVSKNKDNTVVLDHSSDNQSGQSIWWLGIIGIVMLLAAAACFFLPACNVFFTKQDKPPSSTEPSTTINITPDKSSYKYVDKYLCKQYT